MKAKTLFILVSTVSLTTGAYFFYSNKSHAKTPLKAPVIIFDFDGTIADSLDTTVIVVNQILSEYKYPSIVNAEEFKTQHLAAILKAHNIPMYRLPSFHKRALVLMKEKIDYINPIDGIKQAIADLKNLGFTLAVVTSNAEENVKQFLKNNDMEYFDVIYSGASMFGKHKVLKEFLSTCSLTSKDVVYVGDETRDIEACHKADIKVIAATWGFNQKVLLTQANPNFIIDQPEELNDVVSNIFTPTT